MLPVCSSAINRVIFSTIYPSACLSLYYSYCFSFRVSFCSSPLQSTSTYEPRWQRNTQPITNQSQFASAYTTLCQHGNELSLSPPNLNNASWGYHSVTTPVGLREVLHVWSITPNRVTFNAISISSNGDATTYPWPAPFDGVGATENE